MDFLCLGDYARDRLNHTTLKCHLGSQVATALPESDDINEVFQYVKGPPQIDDYFGVEAIRRRIETLKIRKNDVNPDDINVPAIKRIVLNKRIQTEKRFVESLAAQNTQLYGLIHLDSLNLKSAAKQ